MTKKDIMPTAISSLQSQKTSNNFDDLHVSDY